MNRRGFFGVLGGLAAAALIPDVPAIVREHVKLKAVYNGTTLRMSEWMELDRVVLIAARRRLRAWADLDSGNLRPWRERTGLIPYTPCILREPPILISESTT